MHGVMFWGGIFLNFKHLLIRWCPIYQPSIISCVSLGRSCCAYILSWYKCCGCHSNISLELVPDNLSILFSVDVTPRYPGQLSGRAPVTTVTPQYTTQYKLLTPARVSVMCLRCDAGSSLILVSWSVILLYSQRFWTSSTTDKALYAV